MAEQVNKRIEDMINELEQMKRTELFNDEEIREISRKRKEFEYHIQRRVKQKEDYVRYISYELALLEDISLRRKLTKLSEKKKEIEMTIARRLNRLFKQFIYRFQNEIEIYFEYIRFCKGVGFNQAISGIIGQMLQMHGDKPKMWQMASKWESEEENNLNNARNFLVKGIQRHPDSEVLYLELFNIEIMQLVFNSETDEEKEKQLKRTEIVWRNGIKNIDKESFLFELFDTCLKYDVGDPLKSDIKAEIWARKDKKEVWSYIASKELEGCHWEEIEQYLDDENNFPDKINNFIGVYEEALLQFPDEKLCTKYIHELLNVDEKICSDYQKINAVKHAWTYGHEHGLLTDDMYTFGIEMLKTANDVSNEELLEILDIATKRKPLLRSVWEQKLLLNKDNEKKMIGILQEAVKSLKAEDSLHVYNLVLDNIESKEILKSLLMKFLNCDNAILLAVKPKLLQQMYKHNGLNAARDMYKELIKMPPPQIEVHAVMIDIEKSQEKINEKNIRKCFEMAVQHHGSDNVDLWTDYMKFEMESGKAQAAPLIYRRAVGLLKKELVDQFIKEQTLAKIKS